MAFQLLSSVGGKRKTALLEPVYVILLSEGGFWGLFCQLDYQGQGGYWDSGAGVSEAVHGF